MSNHPLSPPPPQRPTHLASTFRSQWETGKRLLNEVSYCVTVKSSCWPRSPQQRSPSVMVITSHLVPSWLAEWFTELERRRLATGLSTCRPSHPLGCICHMRAIDSAPRCKIGFLTWPPVQRPTLLHGLPFSSADGQDSWDNLVI